MLPPGDVKRAFKTLFLSLGGRHKKKKPTVTLFLRDTEKATFLCSFPLTMGQLHGTADWMILLYTTN